MTGKLIVLSIFAWACAVVIVHQLEDILVEEFTKRLPR